MEHPIPRRARLTLPCVPLHLIQRGNNRQACFFADEDCRFYLDWLAEHYPQVTGDDIYVFIFAAKRVYNERKVQH